MEWPLLASLSEAERTEVLSIARRRSFARGEVLVHEGDPADSLHLIASGRLAVRVSISSGDTATVNILSAGEYFGELSLVRAGGDHHRSATVLALEPTETLALSATTFRALCDRTPGVRGLLVEILATRVEELSARLLEALYVGLDRRVYRCLLELCEIYGAGSGLAVIPLTQDNIADLAGGTRPSVNQVLQRLVAQRIVELGRGRVTVIDKESLRHKAGT